ncbi:hypothetical protein Q3V30_00875 [Erwinia pyri]|uniref:Uncharacterized protein n=1 Tax=Erwinia pyri TaxID=3062598 RepID=A0AA50DJR4_9GAMM|nr:hypothetical protein [Erwinia sp. DE2]WLS79105.1 hypothetical protein Q3V30_00875 [Erwinia sp. DE2]
MRASTHFLTKKAFCPGESGEIAYSDYIYLFGHRLTGENHDKPDLLVDFAVMAQPLLSAGTASPRPLKFLYAGLKEFKTGNFPTGCSPLKG